MSQDPKKNDNLVDLAAARRKQKTVQKASPAERGAFGQKKKVNGASAHAPMTMGRKIAAGVQFVIFMVVLYYFMQLCRGPGR